ncbi:MAG TPA: hypothetical protein VGK45_00150, partial [Thermoanaerobaculia bacterium]
SAGARELGIFEQGLRWLSNLWSLPIAQHQGTGSSAQPQAQQSTSGTNPAAPGQTIIPGDKGLGVDPNGVL